MRNSRNGALAFLTVATMLAVAPVAWASAGWKIASVPAQADVLGSISCPTANDCWASDASVVHSTNGGRTWTVANVGVPGGGNDFSQIACPSTSICWIAQASYEGSGAPPFEHTSNGGASWQPVAVPTGIADFAAIACPSTKVCYAAGTASTKHLPEVAVTRNGGKAWSVLTVPKPTSKTNQFDEIACPSTKECFVGGVGPVLRTTNGGAAWTKQVEISSKQRLNAISCPTTKICTAVGVAESGGVLVPLLLHTSDAGLKWKTQNTPKGPSFLNDVTCLGTSQCWAVGSKTNKAFQNTESYVLATHDGGVKWAVQASYVVKPTSNGFLNAIACPTKTHCAAVGRGQAVSSSFAVYTTDGG